MRLTLTPLPGYPLIQPGDDLTLMILDALHCANVELVNGDVLVLAQKIVSKAEGRMVDLSTVEPSQTAQDLAAETHKDPRVVELILQESREIVRTRPGLIVVEHNLGFICANAGIDHSNINSPFPAGEGPGVRVDEFALLLPKDPSASAAALRQKLHATTGAQIGVLIIDSHGRAWRAGTVGMTIGLSGIPGVEDLRGQPDLFGRTLLVTQVGVADELAAAASLMMGQAAEGTPVVHVRGFPYPLREGQFNELLRPKNEDLFR
ncbi:MAG: coenzyme F420-0:L-glutamate ligase [Chloroflexi bacterium]|jgi:coenzyme F420-0:L-glutamate ligase / coenzyme F420-1:gamma-L-glutamate ligase|nr:coenzyme F420-0:L-glutamate ligase [Chloroflexota bacterium]